MSDAMIDEICASRWPKCFRGDGEILANPIGTVPDRSAAGWPAPPSSPIS